ncbi:MAG: TerC family protein [Hyphomicrobiaceae bacterium]|nr:TerC family protein [Hyphomicrobiaceae bacterium]
MTAFGIDLIALLNVIVIDVVLAGDNAVIVGLAASRVAPELRQKVIFWGMAAAVGLRIVFAALATTLLAIVGLTLAGGILLLWVCWKMYREVRAGGHEGHELLDESGAGQAAVPTMTFGAAVMQITFADVSMSLDNVLAVAGAAKGSTEVLVIGLGVAIVLMAVAANFIAKLLVKYPWITWIGLAIIVIVAVDMIYDGSHEVACAMWNGPWCAEGFMGLIKGVLGIKG